MLAKRSKKLSFAEQSIGCVVVVNLALSRLHLKVEYKEQQKFLLSKSIKISGVYLRFS